VKTLSEKLSKYVLDTAFDDLPDDVINRTKISLIDTIGCAIDGSQEDAVKRTAELSIEYDSRKEATMVGFGMKASVLCATLVNSFMLQIHELDDIALAGHPSRVVVPPILAVAEWKGASGKDMLTALSIGYEVQILLMDLMLKFCSGAFSGLDICCAAGTVSVPLSLAKMLKTNEEQTVEAVGVCCSGGFSTIEGTTEGKVAEIFACGFVGQRGITSSLLAGRGILDGYGPREIIEAKHGLLDMYSGGVDLVKAHEVVDRIGRDYLMKDSFYYKLIAQCRASHQAVEAALNMVLEHPLNPDAINEIILISSEPTVVDRTYPKTLAEATFCKPLGVILTILNRRRPLSSDLKLKDDPKVLELMGKIRLRFPKNDIRLAKLPGSAIVEIITKDGKRFVSQVDKQKGMPNDPVTDEEVKTKFKKLSEPVVGTKRSKKIMEDVMHLEDFCDVNDLTKLLTI